MQTFWQKYQVLLTGLIGAVVLSLQQFLGQPSVNWSVIGFAALMAASAWAGNSLRGKGVSVLGILGAAGYAYSITAKGSTVDISQLIIAFMIQAGALIAPPAKPASYEQNPMIVAAKKTVSVLLLILICSVSHAQFFSKTPVPGAASFKLGDVAPAPVVQNLIKPIIGVTAAVSDGTALGGGVGVSFQHSKADPATNSWDIQYSISLVAFLIANANSISGDVGLVLGIPGTGGLVQIGPGYDFQTKKPVLLTGVGIQVF